MLRMRRKNIYADLEKSLGYSFRNRRLIELALTHRSYRFENDGVDCDNQRLEFLGDAALGLAAASEVFKRFADGDEGVLTCVRSRITSGKALAQIAERLNIGARLLLGKGEEHSGGRRRASNLTDALEALLGAAYLDGGMKAIDRIFAKAFVPVLNRTGAGIWDENPKGRLQRETQRKWKNGPVYRVVKQTGPSHARTFAVDVLVNGRAMGRGIGNSKQDAETDAAERALERMKIDRV